MKFKNNLVLFLSSGGIFAHATSSLREVVTEGGFTKGHRRTQGYCENLNSLSPSDDSSCWEVSDKGGCDHQACQQAVCACDDYCCNKEWDLSCSGYFTNSETWVKDNYFVSGCSASIKCCEMEDTLVDPAKFQAEMVNAPGSSVDCENNNWFAPSDSNCWKYNDIPDGLPSSMLGDQKGCDYDLCEQAVCACDSYCCDISWDLSCRGIPGQGNQENNYFIDGCSASILCCEPADAPKPEGVSGPEIVESTNGEEGASETEPQISCDAGGWYAPAYSNCWKYNDIPDGLPSSMLGDQKGCDHDLCEQAVCACDSYCCDVSWDLSCRGMPIDDNILEDNFFVGGCSAAILCCEPADAPKPIEGLPSQAVEPPASNGNGDGSLNNGSGGSGSGGSGGGGNGSGNGSGGGGGGGNGSGNGSGGSGGGGNGSGSGSGGSSIGGNGSGSGSIGIGNNGGSIGIGGIGSGGSSSGIGNIIPCEGNWHAPFDSNCWNYNDQPDNSPSSTIGDQKGCDYEPCQQAVCDCDPYCCDVSWDLSCRGIPAEDQENNYFIDGCSASILCCEPANAPKPIGSTSEAVLPPQPEFIESSEAVEQPVILPAPETKPMPPVIMPVPETPVVMPVPETPVVMPIPENNPMPPVIMPVPGTDPMPPVIMPAPVIDCKSGNWFAPSDSNCWNYNEQPDSSPSSTVGNQKGCDYDLCEQAVCACDPYCCDVSWDKSCRGIPVAQGSPEDNYFIGGCSAAILCCEPANAPKPIDSPPPEAILPPDEPELIVFPDSQPVPPTNPQPQPDPPVTVLPEPQPPIITQPLPDPPVTVLPEPQPPIITQPLPDPQPPIITQPIPDPPAAVLPEPKPQPPVITKPLPVLPVVVETTTTTTVIRGKAKAGGNRDGKYGKQAQADAQAVYPSGKKAQRVYPGRHSGKAKAGGVRAQPVYPGRVSGEGKKGGYYPGGKAKAGGVRAQPVYPGRVSGEGKKGGYYPGARAVQRPGGVTTTAKITTTRVVRRPGKGGNKGVKGGKKRKLNDVGTFSSILSYINGEK